MNMPENNRALRTDRLAPVVAGRRNGTYPNERSDIGNKSTLLNDGDSTLRRELDKTATSDEHRDCKRYRLKDGMLQYKPVHFLGLFSKSSKRRFILDISQDGVQFATREDFKKQAMLSLDISAPFLGKEIIRVRGRVVWVRKAPGIKAYGVGVKFGPMEQTNMAKLKVLLVNAKLNKTNISDSVHLKRIGKLQ